MRHIHAITAAAGLTLSAAAFGGTVQLEHTIRQGTQSGFGFSVLHAPNNAEGAGAVMFRYFGTMRTVYDDAANTLTFTKFDAELYNESNLNPNNLGAKAGTISLVAGSLDINPVTNLIGGSLTLHIAMDNGAAGDATFLFKPIAYNAVANRWKPSDFSFGLWGATADVFGEGPESQIGNTGLFGMGIDLAGTGGTPIVPLPAGAAMGFAGMMGVFGVRRRR